MQAVVRRGTVARLLGDDRPKTLALASGLGQRPRLARMPQWRWPAAKVYLGQPHLRDGMGRRHPRHRGRAADRRTVGACVPDSFWQHLFLTGHPLAAKVWGPVNGPVISVLSFVCSIGNVPLAAVLWNGGIIFGGVIAFIFADLIIIPILVIYRRYYGTKMMLAILGIFYATMVAAGYIIEFAFGRLGLIPAIRPAKVTATGITWNYTTVLNIIFLLLAAALLVRFVRSGGTRCSR
ncbi:MAG TPA: permease [Streptosporangiaceae bacterium]|nr:permease [Streptosporangiaceae bacterium]